MPRKDETTAAFGIYPKQRAKASSPETIKGLDDLVKLLGDIVLPKDAVDVGLMALPVAGNIRKLGAALIAGGATTDAEAGGLSALMRLLSKEAPAQARQIREALGRAYTSNIEHSVVGSADKGPAGSIVSGTYDSVAPNQFDIARALKNSGSIADFHTHPTIGQTAFDISPSSSDFRFASNEYFPGKQDRELRTIIASPADPGSRSPSAYSFFATDNPSKVFDKRKLDAAVFELQRGGSKGTFKSVIDDPRFREYFDYGGSMGELVENIAPLSLLDLRKAQGMGRGEVVLSGRPLSQNSESTNTELFKIMNPSAVELLTRKGFAEGGAVHMDEGGAAFGVFPQMKPRRAKQDREAAANAPLSALRGYAAGTAGLLGDIEGLARAGISQLPPQLLTAFPALRAFGIGSRANPTPQMPTTEFYNEYLPGAQLNQTPTGKAFTTAGNLLGGTGSTSIARLGIKSTAELADLAARIAAEAPRSGSRAAQLGVIKLPGGNQLKGSFENSLKGLKTDVPVFDFSEGRNIKQAEGNFIEQNFPGINQEYSDAFRASGMHSMHYAKNQIPWLKENHPEIIESLLTGKTKDQVLNNWIDKQLTSYMKNDMATPGDPIRALAERGVTYAEMAPLNTYLSDVLGRRRESVGFPAKGFGQSEAAQRWEAAADEAIHNAPARDRLNLPGSEKTLLENPWLAKVSPETMTYGAYANSGPQLGFSHLIDELRNATDSTSNLPSNLRLKSSSLPQLSVPQAVERVSQINAWRAAEAIKAEKAGMMGNLSANSRLEDPTTQLSFVDKPGMKWVDIPETTDKIGLNLCTTIGKQGGWCTQGEGPAKSYGSGPNRLTTLIDADGRPHAQVKITSGFNIEDPVEAIDEIMDIMSAAEQRKFQKYISSDEFATYGIFDHEEVLAWLQSNMPKSYKRYLESVSGPSNITEMKPVENTFSSARALEYKSRDPQYQNKITDSTLKFLNSGEWGSVTDLDHFNIVDLKDTHSVQRALREILDTDLPKDRIDKFNYAVNFNPEANRFMSTRQFSEFLEPPEGFAQGGMVSSNHFDPIKIKQIIASLDDDYDPQRIQQIIAHQESSYA